MMLSGRRLAAGALLLTALAHTAAGALRPPPFVLVRDTRAKKSVGVGAGGEAGTSRRAPPLRGLSRSRSLRARAVRPRPAHARLPARGAAFLCLRARRDVLFAIGDNVPLTHTGDCRSCRSQDKHARMAISPTSILTTPTSAGPPLTPPPPEQLLRTRAGNGAH
jgi:hypothetical protein